MPLPMRISWSRELQGPLGPFDPAQRREAAPTVLEQCSHLRTRPVAGSVKRKDLGPGCMVRLRERAETRSDRRLYTWGFRDPGSHRVYWVPSALRSAERPLRWGCSIVDTSEDRLVGGSVSRQTQSQAAHTTRHAPIDAATHGDFAIDASVAPPPFPRGCREARSHSGGAGPPNEEQL